MKKEYYDIKTAKKNYFWYKIHEHILCIHLGASRI